MIGMDHIMFDRLLHLLDDDLVLHSDLQHSHHTLRPGLRVVRVANTYPKSKSELLALHFKSRRIWVGVQDPSNPKRSLDDEAKLAVASWLRLLQATPFLLSMSTPTHLPLHATADAMATSSLAGSGGAVFFSNGSSAYFQFQITLAQAQSLWPWIGDDLQKHIAAWELLAQFCLTYCIHHMLPRSRGPLSCMQGTDNSAADAASAKGLSMTPAMAMVLTSFFAFIPRFHIFPQVSHIPGHLNDLADALSRFQQPLPVEVQSSQLLDIPWQSLLTDQLVYHVQPDRRWPSHFLAKSPKCIGP